MRRGIDFDHIARPVAEIELEAQDKRPGILAGAWRAGEMIARHSWALLQQRPGV